MDGKILYEEMGRFLTGRGASFTACADLGVLRPELRCGLPVGIVIGVSLDGKIVAGISDGPTPAYAAEYERVNERLSRLGKACAGFLEDRGWRAVAFEPSMFVTDRTRLETPLPHKTVATLAGAGWIGKCALLVTGKWGSAVRINSVLTDAPLPVGEPVTESRCGECELCVEACPAGAASGRNWRAGMERGAFFDAAACRDCASRLALRAGSNRTICGICIAVCPFTRAFIRKAGEEAG